MNRTDPLSANPQNVCRILLVDDDSMSRRTLTRFLERAGHAVVAATGVDNALGLLAKHPLSGFDCVLTDYRMPDKDGLWLLRWLADADPEMAAIMVTAEGEKELVMASLRQGACDFLDKPVDARALGAAVLKAQEMTRHKRNLARAESDVKAVGRIQQEMVGNSIPDCGLDVEFCYHPSHEAGGDYLSVFPLGEQRFLVLATDVSGHDLRAAYLSAYFQGFVRGMMETRTPMEQVLNRFNRFLLEEGARSQSAKSEAAEVTSVAVSTLLLEPGQGLARSLSCGFPLAVYFDGERSVAVMGELWSSPLGWFDDDVGQAIEVSTSPKGSFYLWTDGLEDLALAHGVSPMTLAFALLQAKRRGVTPEWMSQAADDILLACVHVGPVPARSGFLPVFFARYAGADHARVDAFQEEWVKSLRLALPDLAEERLFDVVLCTREIAVNAMKHGCRGAADQSATVVILCDRAREILRVVVSDPGPGHAFDLEEHVRRTEEGLVDEHRGLILIGRLTNRLSTARNGAEVEMDFHFDGPAVPSAAA